MSFLKFLGFKNHMKNTEPSVDYVKPVELPKSQEIYRVGITLDGRTTLTLMSDSGTSLTLTMTQEYCEHLIKILQSTYREDHSDEQPLV